ncbi:RNase adapter RapZ [Rhizorhabdus dicambivorans]|uniref:RNase adapter RapZ n=1 Tax=Rhizorhabdus dicambivorans TaxID=1850238 RepID=A0A2A4FXK0_9SPHN|nr:RNase adapter RapZ [Rhizorhabdus dicambivorans]ATE67337.1 RNase adapter RapZ [Rhizorhabdus dicambivorans]PCE42477.1 RNase adapter RapZ [Rhizorhabdus dicambivorans]
MAGQPRRLLFVTGMSGSGKKTALKALEDMGWETVDNLPLSLLDRLLAASPPEGSVDDERPLALGIDSRTRDFDSAGVVRRARLLRAQGRDAAILFLDCSGAELARRYSETRSRHPLAQDRQVEDGIAEERHLLSPLRDAADELIDTTDRSTNDLQAYLRRVFSDSVAGGITLTVMSFGFSRGVPRDADLMFDMRFLRNPHWVPELKPRTGLDPEVAAYVQADPTYAEARARIEALILLLLPRYEAEGKSYVTIAIGCTGGKHRSVHFAEALAIGLREAGFSPTVRHRELTHQKSDDQESTVPGIGS